ncbi:MAG: hypothetical protein L0Y71_09855 [Gemmataceae bacterium]|nr:hypothetical protein [Gemmataceae bacterium]
MFAVPLVTFAAIVLVRGFPKGSGGILKDRMLLKLGADYFYQDTGAAIAGEEERLFPYPDHAYERTIWKEWREAHPDTDVFVGRLPTRTSP